VHDIGGEQSQDAVEEKSAMPVKDWANVSEEPADGMPRTMKGWRYRWAAP